MATYRITDVWTDVVKLGTVLHTHGAPGGRQRERHDRLTFTEFGTHECVPACRHIDMVTVHTHCIITHTNTHSLPGSIGELEDDVISQVVHFPQPEVIGNVVAVHKRLETQQQHRTVNFTFYQSITESCSSLSSSLPFLYTDPFTSNAWSESSGADFSTKPFSDTPWDWSLCVHHLLKHLIILNITTVCNKNTLLAYIKQKALQRQAVFLLY